MKDVLAFMIKDKHQLQVTIEQLGLLKAAHTNLFINNSETFDIILRKAHYDSLDSMMQELQAEIDEYLNKNAT